MNFLCRFKYLCEQKETHQANVVVAEGVGVLFCLYLWELLHTKRCEYGADILINIAYHEPAEVVSVA